MAVDSAELAREVQDADFFALPLGTHVTIPQPFEAIGLHLTKFMLLELAAAVLMLMIFIPLARRVAVGGPPRGRFWNLFEFLLLFVRDEMVRPAIGGHDADRFLPFVWTLFFFVLFCNLVGLVPWAGSPTAAIAVTAALALVSFVTVVSAGITKIGPVRFWIGLCPKMELPLVLAIVMKPVIIALEAFSLLIKHTILAVRLLANMFAGHLVLAVIVSFIALFANSAAWYGVMPASVFAATALSLLELFVGFLQAYVFAFLTALFIGMSVHQH
jgi:F-type H+-transporting ATPase subunit a